MGSILALGLIMLAIYIKKLHLHIDFKSFFKKGFTPLSNRFRGCVLLSVSRVHGKTYSAVRYSEFLLDNGLCDIFITNIKSYYNNLKTTKRNENFELIFDNDFLNIINFCINHEGKRIVIFYDEIFTTIKKTGSLRKQVLEFLAQCRKRNIIIITTVQEWSELHITMRRFVRFQIECRMFSFPLTKFAIVKNVLNDGDTIHWDGTLNDYVADTIQTNYSKGLKSVILKYDTLETIKSLSVLNE